MTTSTRVGLLHTVPALADSFHSALVREHPGLDIVHIVDPALLATAIADGVTPAVASRVAEHIASLAASGAEAVLVTCSSIGEAAEEAPSSVPVLRVDAVMARDAVAVAARVAQDQARAGRVAVLATLDATVGPTGRLLERAASGNPDVTIEVSVVEGAADARKRGDRDEHDRLIRTAVAAAAERADVIVLAQASMAGALDNLDLPVDVLTSPEGGVRSLLAAVNADVPEAAHRDVASLPDTLTS